jgi:signal transduction histidine kinase
MNTYYGLGVNYMELEQYDSAFYYYNLVLQDTFDYGILRLNATMNIGHIHTLRQEYSKAKPLLFQALNERQKKGYKGDIGYNYLRLAFFYYKVKDYEQAIAYAHKGLDQFKTSKFTERIKELYEILNKSYVATNQYELAHETLLEIQVLNDTINSIEQNKRAQELEVKFEVRQKELENELLKAEQEVAEKNARNTTIIAIGLLLALLLAIGWGYAIYQSNQQKKQMNAQLEQKVQDRTQELNLANKELQQVNYELKTFNYIASHDIKEPIRNIGSFVGLIQRRIPEEIKKNLDFYFSTIKRSTSQLYTLVEDFSKYTTLSKEEVVDLTDVDLNVTAQSIKDYFQETLEEKNGQIIYQDLPVLKTSPSMLFIAIKHLVDNGFKYNNSETPTIEIAYQSTDDTHQIIVSDNGIGIDEQYHERIFEMFKRLHDRAAYKGSGIGLAIVKLMVEKLNGEIQLESEVGVGSRFIIKLPINN